MSPERRTMYVAHPNPAITLKMHTYGGPAKRGMFARGRNELRPYKKR